MRISKLSASKHKKGRILVNGEAEKRPDRKIRPEEDEVVVDGRRIAYAKYEYYMLNKPQGVVSATEDGRYPTLCLLYTSSIP